MHDAYALLEESGMSKACIFLTIFCSSSGNDKKRREFRAGDRDQSAGEDLM
jgi:hypothetical protein